MMKENLAPVIIGIGQLMQNDVRPEDALEPLALMEASCRLALEDAGFAEKQFKTIDYLAVTDVRSWEYHNLPRLLSENLGLYPGRHVMTTLGGNMSQWLVNDTAWKIQRGEVGTALLTGGESYYSARRFRFKGIHPPWRPIKGHPPTEKAHRIGSSRIGFNKLEAKYNLHSAICTYAPL